MLNEKLNIYESGLRDNQNSLTQTEAIHKICEKINLLINHFNLLEYNTNTSIDTFSEKVEYYLNNGMIDEVSEKLDEFSEDGTLDTIINQQIFSDINKQIDNIKTDLNLFKKEYIDNKYKTDDIINSNTNAINENSSKIQSITNEINKITGWLNNVENKVGKIQNDYSSLEVIYGNSGDLVQKYILEDNKMARIRRKYIYCQLSPQDWREKWEYITAGTDNNNGGIWIPFYWAVNKNNVIDTNLTLIHMNKWVWQNLGYSKIGVYGIGNLGENGCFVYIENKDPSESTIGVDFTICITETY